MAAELIIPNWTESVSLRAGKRKSGEPASKFGCAGAGTRRAATQAFPRGGTRSPRLSERGQPCPRVLTVGERADMAVRAPSPRCGGVVAARQPPPQRRGLRNAAYLADRGGIAA